MFAIHNLSHIFEYRSYFVFPEGQLKDPKKIVDLKLLLFQDNYNSEVKMCGKCSWDNHLRSDIPTKGDHLDFNIEYGLQSMISTYKKC